MESKLNSYFNASCFVSPPIIGSDGIATGFGNSATGIVDGPGQANMDFALSKTVALRWPDQNSSSPISGRVLQRIESSAVCQPRCQLHLTDVRCHFQHGSKRSCRTAGDEVYVLDQEKLGKPLKCASISSEVRFVRQAAHSDYTP